MIAHAGNASWCVLTNTLSLRRGGPAPDCNPDRLSATIKSMSIAERRIHCPFCAESMTILLDLSAGDQSYIEDCQICCQPMQISFESDCDDIMGLQVDCAS